MSLSLRSAGSQCLKNYTTIENNYGQLRQMELIVVQITFCNSLHKGRGINGNIGIFSPLLFVIRSGFSDGRSPVSEDIVFVFPLSCL